MNDKDGRCLCRLKYGKCKFVNGNRSNNEKRVRYCFLRKCVGLNRIETRMLMGYSDSRVVRYLSNFKN